LLTADPDKAAARTSRHHRIPHTLTSNLFVTSGGQHMTTRVSAGHPIRVIPRGCRRRMADVSGRLHGLRFSGNACLRAGRVDRLCGPRVCHLDGERPRDNCGATGNTGGFAPPADRRDTDLPTPPVAPRTISSRSRTTEWAYRSPRSRAARPHQSTRAAGQASSTCSSPPTSSAATPINTSSSTRAPPMPNRTHPTSSGPTRSRRTHSRRRRRGARRDHNGDQAGDPRPNPSPADRRHAGRVSSTRMSGGVDLRAARIRRATD
jgi:hypothetical protein